ncbi:MAG: phosphomannose isomerase type II C-terminal cupin domain [Actinomycetia bacterium]|nr:phosphomannose isomerase type II C-terminal cupin domain [Actinomycetes bacterium]
MHDDARSRHLRDERPWGHFDQYCHNEMTTVKVITVQPGQRLSLQRHAQRSECWVVLDGPMDVTVGEQTWSAESGEKVWIPVGAVHRMGNSGAAPARILEIAYGEFDEDDIERLEDDYSR